MLTNLLANALRHSPAGAPVAVAARNGDDDGGVTITVTDQGSGIPPAEAERVFERFYRTDAGRAASDGGSGLGLAIAQWIADLHGGTLRVDGDHGGGCRMVLTLPRHAPPAG